MVVLETKFSELKKFVGKNLTEKQLEELLFNIGFELEDISDDDIKIEITAERPDLLSTQGLARAVRSYLGLKNKNYEVKKSNENIDVVVEANEWPYVVACVVKNLKFDDEKIKEVIRIQEKLGSTYLRNRKKGGLGIYPLEGIKFPVKYTSEEPSKIIFRPLEFDNELNGYEILEKHPTGRIYKNIIEKWKKFPIFVDNEGKIMSMPPIINSHNLGKIDENTVNVFVEATGNDFKTINIAFNVLVGALMDMGGEVYTLNINYKKNKILAPDFSEEKRTIELKKINSVLGTEMKSEDVKKFLEKMMYEVKSFDENNLRIVVPSTRSDIWHDIDIIDDVARAYGFNNFEPRIKNVESFGSTTKSVKIKEEISTLLVGMGYQEVFTLILTNTNDQFDRMNLKETECIKLERSAEAGINMARSWLTPELIKVLHSNRSVEYPHKIFEVNYVINPDKESDVKSKDTLKLSVITSHSTANFTEIKQILDALAKALGLEYEIEELNHPSFISGRSGKININKKEIAIIGEIHPQVLKNWGLEMPVATLEIELNSIFNLNSGNNGL